MMLAASPRRAEEIQGCRVGAGVKKQGQPAASRLGGDGRYLRRTKTVQCPRDPQPPKVAGRRRNPELPDRMANEGGNMHVRESILVAAMVIVAGGVTPAVAQKMLASYPT